MLSFTIHRVSICHNFEFCYFRFKLLIECLLIIHKQSSMQPTIRVILQITHLNSDFYLTPTIQLKLKLKAIYNITTANLTERLTKCNSFYSKCIKSKNYSHLIMSWKLSIS